MCVCVCVCEWVRDVAYLQRRLNDTATQTQHQMQRRLLLNVVVGERATVFQLLAGENQPLLIRGDALLVLDLGLDAFDRVTRLHVKRDRLAGQRLHKNLQ